MKLSIFSKTFFAFLFILILSSKGNRGYGQILVYTNDTGGILNMVDTHATGDTLRRVNMASRLSTPCTHGFSTRSFTNASVYSDTLPAVEVSVAPDNGYILRVDSFNAALRHSPTGPANARFAYSTDSITWTDQGIDQLPFASGTCDSMDTCTWIKSITVNYPKRLFFRIYGFNTSVTTGTGNLQIMNLVINGKVQTPGSTSVSEVNNDAVNFVVYPNPAAQNATITYHLSGEEKVNMRIYNVVGQMISPVVNESQQAGDYNYNIPVTVPGIYFVKLYIGGSAFTKKIVKL